jgi:hypothetical protein
LEAEGGGFEAVGTGRVGGHCVGEHVAMKDQPCATRAVGIETYLGCAIYCSPSFNSTE